MFYQQHKEAMIYRDEPKVALVVLLAKFRIIKVKQVSVSHVLTMIRNIGALIPACSIALPVVDLYYRYLQVLRNDEEV